MATDTERSRSEHIELHKTLVVEWKEGLIYLSVGLRTIEGVLQALEQLMDRRHGVIRFRLTRVLSGHGYFGKYVYQIAKKEPSAECYRRGDDGRLEDTALHTLKKYPA
ncbi:hypothetical protein EVAR_94552_1 [Eumeta japonica]|uniref:Uncharacterized protein n=1 Tax=Eumeta variegata TaxID=151549 RepID=A0A4C1UUR8_EUMVA|nr:hypothetical protein EVAR_94552_1 [Eumeta japonica]